MGFPKLVGADKHKIIAEVSNALGLDKYAMRLDE
jgi:hypothetical protein